MDGGGGVPIEPAEAPVPRRLSVRMGPVGREAGDPPTVSVVIPNYNYARFLPAAIGSVLSQEGVQVDVIVVDDASTDDSRAVAMSHARRDPRVRLIERPRNGGPVETFNAGLAEAHGEFLVRLDADDLLTPGSLMRAVAVARRFPSVGLVYGHPLHFSGERLPPPRGRATHVTVWPGRQWLADRCRSGYNVITSPEVLMRRSVVARVGGQRPLAHSHDMEMWLRMATAGDVAYLHGADQAWHRDHRLSLSALHVDGYRDLLERHAAFDTLFAGLESPLPGAASMRADAMRAIAAACLRHALNRYDRRRDIEEAERCVAFARSIVPDLAAVPHWRSLQRRLATGPARDLARPLIFIDRATRRLASEWRWRRWHRSGVF